VGNRSVEVNNVVMRVPSDKRLLTPLAVTLFAFIAANCTPLSAETPPERFWLAGRYDGRRVIIYFDAVQFHGTVPPTAKKIPDPVAGGFLIPIKLPASYVAQFQKKPDAEHFALGDTYDLLLDEGKVAVVTLTTLVGTESDEEVGNDSFIGALATLKNTDDVMYFSKSIYAVRRHRSQSSGPKPPFDPKAVHAGLEDEPVRFDIQSQMVALLSERMQTTATKAERQEIGNISPVFEVQAFHLADGTLRYYTRAEWMSENDEHQDDDNSIFALGAWFSPAPKLHILAVEPRTSRYSGLENVLPSLVNVLDLGGGKTGIIVDSSGDDSHSLDLVEYRDGTALKYMHSLQSIGAGE